MTKSKNLLSKLLRSRFPRALVVEDRVHVVDSLRNMLESAGIRRDKIDDVSNGAEAIESLKRSQYAVMILDIDLPKINGREVLDWMAKEPSQSKTAVIVYTVLEEDVRRSFGKKVFFALDKNASSPEQLFKAIQIALDVKDPLYEATVDSSVDLFLEPQKNVGIRCHGHNPVSRSSSGVLELDLATYGWQAKKAMYPNWREETRSTGEELFAKTFDNHPEVLSDYRDHLRTAGAFRLVLETSMDLMRIPFEFCFDRNSNNGGDYLVKRHAFVRRLMGVPATRPAVSRAWLNAMDLSKKEMQVLLVGSNARGDLGNVDQEISEIHEMLTMAREEFGFPVHSEVLPSSDATREKFSELVTSGRFHVVHYAGHSHYDHQRPEQSHLLLKPAEWSSPRPDQLMAGQLTHLLESSAVSLFYFSSCSGTSSGSEEKYGDNDSLSLAEASLRGAVPSVIGFRNGVRDTVARVFATHFYAYLLCHGDPCSAVWCARKEVAALMPDDPAWLSAVCVHQA